MDGFLDAPPFVRFAGATGFDGEAIMLGEVLVARMEHGRLARRNGEHGGLAIVHNDLRRHAAEVFEGVLMAGQEVLLRRGQGELDLHPAAVSQHQDKEGETAAGGAHTQPTGRTPAPLRTLAHGELYCEEGRAGRGAHVRDIVGEGRVTARITGLAQALEELLAGR